MQAILFPTTYVSETDCEAVRTCFQSVRIYQPTRRQVPPQMQALSQRGLIDISIPAEEDDKKIEILVRDYRNWAGLHQGGLLDYAKRQRGSIPFFDDTAIAQIKADIQHAARPPEADDPLFNARVFLQIAQAYDLESEEIARKLDYMNQAEQDLFRNITGESGTPHSNVLRPQPKTGIDSYGYMTSSRILAWAQLFLKDSAFDPMGMPAVFVTTGREALEFLTEQAPATERLLKIASLPIMSPLSERYQDWQNGLNRILDSLPENASAQAADLIARLGGINLSGLTVDLTLYRIPGESPSVFFARCVDHPTSQESLANLSGTGSQTLLGLVERDYNRLKTEG